MDKKTKIIATISDMRCDGDFLKELISKGVNAFRLNTAHQTPEMTLEVVKKIRGVSKEIPIIVDIKGPEVRICKDVEVLEIKAGDTVEIGNGKRIDVNYGGFVNEISEGNMILIDDGDICLKVISKEGGFLICEAENSGKIKPRKSVNVPGVHLNVPSLSDKDREYIEFCIENEIDFIAHSFVRGERDLREILDRFDQTKCKTKIISKIENQEGVDNIDEILDHTYAVMIARGDLGIEIPMERIPSIQRKLIDKCIERRRPVIVATQMLHTMIENPRPTRAEVSDVANAVLSGADCLMLSGETTNGDYPVLAVQTMTKIIKEVEKDFEFKVPDVKPMDNEVASFLSKTAVKSSFKLGAKAIVADTLTGRTARYISSFRSKTPVFVQSYCESVSRQLAISYGIKSRYVEMYSSVNEFVKSTLNILIEEEGLSKEDLVAVVAGSFGYSHGASFVEISEVKNLVA